MRARDRWRLAARAVVWAATGAAHWAPRLPWDGTERRRTLAFPVAADVREVRRQIRVGYDLAHAELDRVEAQLAMYHAARGHR